MLCSKCKTNNATFVYTQNINGKESTIALCKSCAKASGLDTSLVSPLFNSFFSNTKRNIQTEKDIKKCTLCALTFNDILAMGKVGCPECYKTFKDELNSTIRSIHGSAKHVGLTPTGFHQEEKEEPSEEELLRKKLNLAIEAENYEEAATLRDAIKALKGEG